MYNKNLQKKLEEKEKKNGQIWLLYFGKVERVEKIEKEKKTSVKTKTTTW